MYVCISWTWNRGYRSLKVIKIGCHSFESLGAVSYSPSIVTMAIFVSFARYSDLLVENREIFIPHLYLAPPQGVTPSEFCEMFDTDKTRMIGAQSF